MVAATNEPSVVLLKVGRRHYVHDSKLLGGRTAGFVSLKESVTRNFQDFKTSFLNRYSAKGHSFMDMTVLKLLQSTAETVEDYITRVLNKCAEANELPEHLKV